MKSLKPKEHSKKQLQRTIQMYTQAREKQKSTMSSSNFKKCKYSLENVLDEKKQILKEKYSELIDHLQNYKKKIQNGIEEELLKNENNFLQMSKLIQNHRKESKKWLKQKKEQNNKILDETMLKLQTKLYQITRQKMKKPFQHELQEYQNMKVLQITIYEVKNIDLHEFYKDIKKYCICENCQRKTENESEIKWEEEDYGIFTKKINKQKAIENSNKENKQKKIISLKKNIDTIKKEPLNSKKEEEFNIFDTGDDLMCMQEIDWENSRPRDKNMRNFLISDVIVEQSEVSEDSIIYNTQF